ncbi:MAG: iron uptake system protein EfeO [Bacillaceae bacterium]
MKYANKTIAVTLLSSMLVIPVLAGCNSDGKKEEMATKQTATETSNDPIKATALSLQKSLQAFNQVVEKNNKSDIQKSGKGLNTEWLEKETNIREVYPLLYTEIEKYIQPLYMEATSDNPDQKKLQDLSTKLDEALVKLSNAKESEEKTSASLDKAVQQYKQYVDEEVAALVTATKTFTDAVISNDVEKAKQYYVESRTHYERVEPIAESFGDLDPKIDAREGDVDDAEWSGFHKIEKALWETKSLKDMNKVAEQLYTDVLSLQEKVKEVQLKPTQVVAGSMELINEAAISKITGEEERYSHVDLMDLAANVEGSQAVYYAILPALTEKDKELATKLDKQFIALNDTLLTHKKNGQYVLYTELKKEDIRDLSQKLGVLAELMGSTATILQ